MVPSGYREMPCVPASERYVAALVVGREVGRLGGASVAVLLAVSWEKLSLSALAALFALTFVAFLASLALTVAALALVGNLFYVLVYTILLKRTTPQNIVIGGAAGALPPVIGWAAVTGQVTIEAMLLFLIIFAWTPPHFWSLALYRADDYARAGLPMLPVTHGRKYTQLQVLLYTVILLGVSLLPYVVRMSGMPYFVAACALGAVFLVYAVRIYRRYSDGLARRMFRYSIVYLAALFAALLVDHYLAL